MARQNIRERAASMQKNKRTNFIILISCFLLIIGAGCALVLGTCDAKPNQKEMLEVSNKWAETWQSRDGKARYELMDDKMQKTFYKQQSEVNGKEGVWVIRWSSPWVESYDILLEEDQAVITYHYSDATSAKYESVERLYLNKTNGKVLVIKAILEKELFELKGIS